MSKRGRRYSTVDSACRDDSVPTVADSPGVFPSGTEGCPSSRRPAVRLLSGLRFDDDVVLDVLYAFDVARDLFGALLRRWRVHEAAELNDVLEGLDVDLHCADLRILRDRKSTRLNSSH